MRSYSTLELIGIVILLIVIYRIAKVLWKEIFTYVIGPAIHKVDFKSKGKWALVTGATDGIGKEYARQLAAKGCDIVLVSRSIEKLQSTAEEIEKDFKVNTKIVKADFSEGEEIYDHISKEIEDLEIGTLVNNVGVSYSYPEYFLEVPDWSKMMDTLIKANAVSMIRMSGLVMPGMVKRGRGVVINIGSASSVLPSPLLSVYAASKAFVEKFSESLKMEYEKSGIVIQVVKPGFVCSNMSQIRRSTFLAPTAKKFVRSALSTVGVTSNTTGFFPHDLLVLSMDLIRGISEPFAAWLVLRNMERSRARALKKRAKLEA